MAMRPPFRWLLGLGFCAAFPGAGGCVSDVGPTTTSCEGLAATCGPQRTESCCAVQTVVGGQYDRIDEVGDLYPTTVSNFQLDRFEVTVGRFRRFFEGYPLTRPAAGAGAHPLIMNSGWSSEWDGGLPADQEALRAEVKCEENFRTWTDAPGANEDLPMNCVDWLVAFAFCAWDGGRLPTEAEWNYAAAGGNEYRTYPWSDAAPDATFAVYDCAADGSAAADCQISDILAVGARSPKGDNKWGQADLAGGMGEWTMDWNVGYPAQCDNCASLEGGDARIARGGDWSHDATLLTTFNRIAYQPMDRQNFLGIRCARTP